MKWPRTLFCRTTLVIASVSVAFQIFAIGAIAYFALVPLGQRAADDLAARLVDVAQDWGQLPESARQDYMDHALHTYEVRVAALDTPLSNFSKRLPYYYFIENALSQRTGQDIELRIDPGASRSPWLWADIPTPGGPVRVGFSSERSGVFPPGALALILIVGTAATLITSTFLARRLTAPLRRLSTAARRMGAGESPEPLPGGGPEEFDTCVNSFNRMVTQVQDLLASRTTLLAGISHDLRTPLARMRLALGMLSEGHDPVLANQLMRDVDAMNDLIGRCLELGQGFEEPIKDADPGALLNEIIDAARRAGNQVEYIPTVPTRLPMRSLAFRRVVGNLLDNALRYGGAEPPVVKFDTERLEISVLDRGPGIPEAEREAVFRPFHRLEPSRSTRTGGSGLGLAIVQQLGRANGWQVRFGSRPGGGTVALLLLARSEANAAPDCAAISMTNPGFHQGSSGHACSQEVKAGIIPRRSGKTPTRRIQELGMAADSDEP
jgi:two-component system osmolarity sensor histidine kinase EnvZ